MSYIAFFFIPAESISIYSLRTFAIIIPQLYGNINEIYSPLQS